MGAKTLFVPAVSTSRVMVSSVRLACPARRLVVSTIMGSMAVKSSISEIGTKSPYCPTSAITLLTFSLLPWGVTPSVNWVSALGSESILRNSMVLPPFLGMGYCVPNWSCTSAGCAVSISCFS